MKNKVDKYIDDCIELIKTESEYYDEYKNILRDLEYFVDKNPLYLTLEECNKKYELMLRLGEVILLRGILRGKKIKDNKESEV